MYSTGAGFGEGEFLAFGLGFLSFRAKGLQNKYKSLHSSCLCLAHSFLALRDRIFATRA